MEASQTQQAPEPEPGESQREFEARTGGPAAQESVGAAPESAQAPSQAEQVAQGAQGPQVPASVAQAPAGSLAQGAPEPEAEREITHTEPILAQGASGEPVMRLVRLLAAAGYATNSVVNAANPHTVLDSSIMADVQRLRAEHPEAAEPDELFAGRDAGIHELQGSWVGPNTWQTLYELANKAGA